ncbi:MAG: hypothetical protein J1F67_05060 [Muribaculaceae bacterium]|nr:hypothetical protein [Muribaculaceae bacterium]
MRKISIATGKSRFQQRGWENKSYGWDELVELLSSPAVTDETMEEYRAMPHDKRTQVKDVGGFIGGYLSDGKRRMESVYCRDLLTYDYDSFTQEGLERLREQMSGLVWCLYSTHSHTETDWRVRILIPLEKEVMPEQFPAVARKIAEKIGFDGLDRGSFDLNRLMFWPSVSKDGPYMFESGEGDFLNPASVLAEYEDWRNPEEWPLLPEENAASLFGGNDNIGSVIKAFSRKGNGGRMEDPAEKKGIIGAFCRTYDIKAAISKFLSHLYTPAPNGHFTHVGSSTTGNAFVRGDGKFLYSFHGTDPLQRRMLNSWDLVRLGLYRELDESIKEETRLGRLPSTKAMEELAMRDKAVKVRYLKEKGNDFDGLDGLDIRDKESGMGDKDEEDLLASLDMQKGEIAVTAANVERILDGDPNLKGKMRMDLFRDNVQILGELPWNTNSRYWGNKDTDCLLTYFDKVYGMRKNTTIIERTFSALMYDRGVHPVKEYLNGLPEWDGEERLGKLFTHVLGAEETALNRKLAEMIFVAAVRRIWEPGVKYDYCVVLYGPEGAYKSTLFSVMGGEWFSDSVNSIEGKEGMEGVQGIWIAEISELTGLKRSELSTQKQFISRQEDIYRPAFGKMKEWKPRQCVMAGTTNEEHFLKGIVDANRRMPVVEIKPELRKIDCNPREWLIEHRDQLWAEAKEIEKKGEPLYLGEEFREELKKIQEDHNMDLADPLFMAIQDYLDWWLPYGWEKQSREARIMNIEDVHEEADHKHQRQIVTIPEIVEECMGMNKSHAGYSNMARKVGQYLRRIPGWKFAGSWRGPYGCQKTWKRDETATEGYNSFSCTTADLLNDL